MQGVVAIFISTSGNVISAVADFEEGGYGGFTKQESRKIRAKTILVRKVVQAYCSQELTDNISPYTYERIFDDLLRSGAKIHYEYIGGEE